MTRLLFLSALIVYIFVCCSPTVYIFTCCPSSTPSSPTPIAEAATLQPSAVPPEPTDTPMPSPPPAETTTVAPKYPAPRLVGPGDGSNFKPNDDILLMWDTPTPLSEDEWYEVQLWKEGEPPKVVQRVKEGTWKVERSYYPGGYQWRIRIVRGQEGKKERDLSPPSQTWSFSWLSPVVQAPTAPTSSPDIEAPVDLTVYLRGTNNAQGFATFRGEHVDAGMIYTEGGYIYGDVAVQIGDTVYHSDEELASGEPRPLPAPYRLEVQFPESLVAVTEGKPGFNPQKAQFWVGELDCNSATQDEPYKIEMTLYAGGEARKYTEVSFLVADNPSCGAECEEPEPCQTICPRP